jgi:hypothetical protein
MKRCPAPMGPDQDAVIELRQVAEATDFPADVFPPEEVAKEDALREKLKENAGR